MIVEKFSPEYFSSKVISTSYLANEVEGWVRLRKKKENDTRKKNLYYSDTAQFFPGDLTRTDA